MVWGVEEREESFEEIIKIFEDHCVTRKNVTYYERYMFSMRMQNEGETEEFVTYLKLKSQPCKYGILKDSLKTDGPGV